MSSADTIIYIASIILFREMTVLLCRYLLDNIDEVIDVVKVNDKSKLIAGIWIVIGIIAYIFNPTAIIVGLLLTIAVILEK